MDREVFSADRNLTRGYHIAVIIPLFQRGNRGSTPLTRSNLTGSRKINQIKDLDFAGQDTSVGSIPIARFRLIENS